MHKMIYYTRQLTTTSLDADASRPLDVSLALPGEFLFLFRIRFGLMSVLSRLGARANWYRLEKRYLEDFRE